MTEKTQRILAELAEQPLSLPDWDRSGRAPQSRMLCYTEPRSS